MLHRDDGQALIYPGEIHAFNAPSEAGKSWLALAACVEQVNTGAHVVYIDLEDSAEGITERLTALGAHPGLLYGPDRLFHYVRPDDPIDPTGITRLVRLGPTLVVIDGVTEAMSMNGFSIKDNDDIAVFLKVLPRVFARAGAAVILIDHVVKNKDERGDDAIGGQHKRAGIAASATSSRRSDRSAATWAAPPASSRPRTGSATSEPDAPAAAPQASSASSPPATPSRSPSPHPSRSSTPTPGSGRPCTCNACPKPSNTPTPPASSPHPTTVKKLVPGKNTIVHRALELLVAEGYIDIKVGPQHSPPHLRRPYRETDDPASPLHSTTNSGDQEEVEQF
jgi:hypothetical protein